MPTALFLPPPVLALVPPELLRWFDASPGWYWAGAWAAWSLAAVLVLARLAADWHPVVAGARRIPQWLLHPLTFSGAVVLAVLAFRWPMVFAGPLANPDETQLGAGAMTYWRDPVPWRSVDLHTSGPLNAYFLWPALLINGRIDYAGLRLAALAAHLGAVLACYGLLRRFASEGVARLAALPLVSFLAFTSLWEFVQYSSEQLSVCLLGVGAWLLAEACTLDDANEQPRRWRLFLAGLCLGCLPFAKTQVTPLGLMVGAFGIAATWQVPAGPWRPRARRVAVLVTGALIPALGFTLILTVYGLWAQFQAAYFESNSFYLLGYDEARWSNLWNFYSVFLEYNYAFRAFALGSVGAVLAAGLTGGILRLRPRALLAGALALTVLSLWSALYPGRPFWHYLHLVLLPLAWLAGFSLMGVMRVAEATASSRWLAASRWLVVAGFAALTLVPQIASRANDPHPVVGSLDRARLASLHPVSARLRALAQPGDTLVVWGWAPRFYTESGLPQAARDAHTYHQIERRQMQRFFRDRMMRDLKKHPPTFIVDAVCPGSFTYVDRQESGMQIFPEFAAFVERDYRLEENLNGYLIYVRRDRANRPTPAT